MKSLLKLSLLLLITSLLFTSCNSKLSLTKRHYSKGYYIAHNTGKHAKPSSMKKKEQTTPVYTVKINPNLKPIGSVTTVKKQDVLTTQATARSSKTTNKVAVQNQEKILLYSDKTTPLITPLKNLREAYLSAHSDENHHRHHSLFWIIILVIILLWFFGYLAGWGTGGLINLLLLIALILFILWLLRII